MAGMIVCSFAFYYHKACFNRDVYEHDSNLYKAEVGDEKTKLVWVMFIVLACIFFVVGCIMLNRLKLYYKDFYKEFGG